MDPGGVPVALVDTGVNYTLPQIATRLARDGEGDIIGVDLIDRDNKPFDDTPAGTEPVGAAHGTLLASAMLQQPGVRLVPLRAPVGEPRAVAAAIAMVARMPARIVVVRPAFARDADWEPVRAAIAAHPALLVLIAAGSSGVDLDAAPGGLGQVRLPNVVVAAACDAQGRLHPQSERGGTVIDVAVNIAGVVAADVAGRPVEPSPVLTAAVLAGWAASEMGRQPGIDVNGLKRALLARARPWPAEAGQPTAAGCLLAAP
jgi:subtilisin family serine protease